MNFKLILLLSLFGLAMAIGTTYVIPSKIEFLLWLGILVLCAYIIAKKAPGKYFLHGFLVSMINTVWVTGAHLILYNDFIAHHPEELEMMSNMQTAHENLKIMMMVTGPVIGIISGILMGLLAFIAGRIVERKAHVNVEPG
ncbi:MAG: hypothetical protein HZB41_06625 [Ignavibacteriae bacterium]|nr:hypothetical protein [Ignavibacteriota bacterium]